jgi:transcriptional regulator with XRE-family HTH domain
VWESQKREREELTRTLRARGATWVEVAEAIRQRYGVNARVAFRLARGWSQQQAADEWNKLWPEESKTLKNFSYWEQWPGKTGHAPSLDVLSRLAKLYKCKVGDLLEDVADHRNDDDAHKAMVAVGNERAAPSTIVVEPDGAADLFAGIFSQRTSFAVTAELALAQQIRNLSFDELARLITMWAEKWNPRIGRRDLIKLSTALSVAAAAPTFDWADVDPEHLSRIALDSSQFDEPALRYCEGAVMNLRRQSDILGPKLTLHSAMGHRHLASRLAKEAPSQHRSRALSAYAELTQLMGWLSFNLADYRGAQQYYDEARTAAHDAENTELVTYVLCTMSHLATWQGRPRVGIDHAAAAAVWAEQSQSPRAQAYAADVAVRAYIADNQRDKGRSVLDFEHSRLNAEEKAGPPGSWWYFYDQSFYWATETLFELKFKNPDGALRAIETSLKLVDPSNMHERAHRSLHRAEAYLLKDGISEACTLIGEVASITTVNSSGRFDQRLGALRTSLTPWERTRPVRELDQVLDYRSAAIGSGK